MYNCHSKRGDRGYWRCHNYSKRLVEQRCRARCVIVDGEVQSLTGGQHNHPPHTDKINKISQRNEIFDESARFQADMMDNFTEYVDNLCDPGDIIIVHDDFNDSILSV